MAHFAQKRAKLVLLVIIWPEGPNNPITAITLLHYKIKFKNLNFIIYKKKKIKFKFNLNLFQFWR